LGFPTTRTKTAFGCGLASSQVTWMNLNMLSFQLIFTFVGSAGSAAAGGAVRVAASRARPSRAAIDFKGSPG
jgi:hypothetical protein